MQELNALTRTEMRVLAAANDGATFEEICAAVDASPDYIRNLLPKLVGDGLMVKDAPRYTARVKVKVEVER